MGKAILCFRLDSLPAKVEQLRNPDFVGQPVVVGKSVKGTSGVVISASPEARKQGVVDGQSIRHAQRLCPNGIFLSARFGLYRRYAHQAFDVMAEYSPLVEPQSVEKAFVDVTLSRNLFGDAGRIAKDIAGRIVKGTGLDVAVGIAGSKFVAEAASHSCPTNKIIEVIPGMEGQYLTKLPVKLIWGIGEKTERKLAALRVQTIGQLSAIPERFLVRHFGQVGSSFHRLSLGIDHSQVLSSYPFETIITEHMFDNEVEEPEEIREHLPQMADRLAIELRKRGKVAETISVRLDGEISSCRLKRPADSSGVILHVVNRLLGFTMKAGMKVTEVEIELSELSVAGGIQLDLLGDGDSKKRLNSALETIKDRFGERSISYASLLTASGVETVLSRVVA